MPKILLVEDNEMNRDMLSRRLVRNGFEVVIAVDGVKGVSMAGSERPDLILMDMSLPEIDGWEATRRVKADPATKSIPVIALTAHAMAEDKEKSLAAGCDDFDTKPVELPRLLAKIQALLAKVGAAKVAPHDCDHDASDDAMRVQRALLAHLRQEFIAPAAAIVGYTEILIEDAKRLSFDAYLPDLERIRNAGGALHTLLQSVLSPRALRRSGDFRPIQAPARSANADQRD